MQFLNAVQEDESIRPTTYCRYVDDIYVVVSDERHLQALRHAMESNSVLKFTYELSVNNKIPFLDIMITKEEDKYVTTVYRKNTDVGRCLNARSECPDRSKVSVIRSFIRRAYKTCSSWDLFHHEVSRSKQILINNGYSNHMVDTEICKILSKSFAPPTFHEPNPNSTSHNLYYCNQMTPAYKTDERVLQDIVKQNVSCSNPNDTIKLVIHCKNKNVSNQIMKNNISQNPNPSQHSNVGYEFSCPNEGCKLRNMNYIGMTTTTLSRRLTMHLQSGSIKDHMREQHQSTLNRKELTENTKILKYCHDSTRLLITEALLIRNKRPTLNNQTTGLDRTFNLFSSNTRTTPSEQPTETISSSNNNNNNTHADTDGQTPIQP